MKMVEIHLGLNRVCDPWKPYQQLATMARCSSRICRKVAFSSLRPGHRTTVGIGVLAQSLPPIIIGEQRCNLFTDAAGIAERNQDATSVCKQLACVPIRSRD